MLNPSLDRGAGGCSSNASIETTFRHFQLVDPGQGTITFTDRGAMRRRTFRGTVAPNPENARSGQGTDPQGNGNPQQSVWSFGTGVSARFTLAPR
jgi:hypothetical protein